MSSLFAAQIATFHETGCLVVPDAVRPDQLAAMNAALAGWIEDSRAHGRPFGETIDRRPRFDVQPGHSAARPALRRVQSPTELSDAYLDTLRAGPLIEIMAALIGPDLRLHHSKVNCKLPGSGTAVGWHQDFAFDPHSNDDMITSLVFLDDVTEENGPLMTVPGSHREAMHSHWHDGRFTGAVSASVAADCDARAVSHTGPAGSVCFMHSRVLHGSTVNRGTRPRNLFISQIAAADAVPLARNAVPSRHQGLLLRGREPNRIRCMEFAIAPPEVPETTFFDQQAGAGG